MDQTFLIYSHNQSDVDWLQSILAPSQVLCVNEQLEDLLGVVDVTGSNLVFVGLEPENMVSQCGIIEGLLEARPFLTVVGLGDGFDNQIVINAMRAGARDFIVYGMRTSEVQGLIRRLTQRLPTLPSKRDQGELTLIYGVQADADAALLASHLALRIQKDKERVLLLDLGIPNGESLEILGVQTSFYFGDALRNLRRLDENLIDSAFARHSSGLTVLAYSELDALLSSVHSTELYLLLGALRQHFKYIIINACGQVDSEALRTFVSNSQRVFWYVNQSVSCCKRNMELMQSWQEKGLPLEQSALIIDKYLPNVAPNAKSIESSFRLPLMAQLPLSAATRMNAKNQRRSMCDMAPRDPLSCALNELANGIVYSDGQPSSRWWQRLIGGKK